VVKIFGYKKAFVEGNHSFGFRLMIAQNRQGGQIWGIFAYWVNVYFWQWLENYKDSANFWQLFPAVPATY
jgi:hypothetical protein